MTTFNMTTNAYWNNYFFHQLPNLASSNTPAPTWVWVAVGILLVGFIGFIIWLLRE